MHELNEKLYTAKSYLSIISLNAQSIYVKLPNFAITDSIFFNRLLKTCIFVKRTCISIFSKIEFVDQSKPCTQIYLINIASCINLQLPIVILKKKILLDMHHHKMYMYINFQQNQVKTQVMTVHTSLFAQNRKLHKFAATNNKF